MFFSSFRRKILKKRVLSELNKLKDKKGFFKAGFPSYNRLFGRDSLISAWQLLDENFAIAKATLEVLSQYQGKVVNNEREEEPGKIIHETDLEKKWHPEGYFPFPYYGSVDSTPLFLILFSFYWRKTKDEKFLNLHWENILKAINWIKDYGDKDRDLFLEYQRKNPTGLFHQGWKDSFLNHLKIEPPVAIVEAQGYQYLALREISKIAKEKNNFDLSEELNQRTDKLKEEFNKKFWMEEEKYFCLALNGKKEQIKTITSNPGHLLFTEIIDEGKLDLVVKRLFQEDLWTDYGIRTHSEKELDFDPKSYHLGSVWPHDNWIIAQGLKKLGYQKEYQKIKNAILKAYDELGFLPEYYIVSQNRITIDPFNKPCYPQAWASGALFNFISE